MHDIEIEVETTVEWIATPAESGRWVAACDSLGLAMEGSSLDELHGLIGEASFALFSDLLKDDEFDQFLTERGWRAVTKPAPSAADDIGFSIPWNLVAQGSDYDPERRPH